MTDEEIKKLAEECSLYYQGCPAKRGYELSNRLTIESYALMTLKYLSERYCIVPKEQIKEKYALYKMGYTECEGLELGFVMDALEDIFGKEMFEEEKE